MMMKKPVSQLCLGLSLMAFVLTGYAAVPVPPSAPAVVKAEKKVKRKTAGRVVKQAVRTGIR